MEHEVIHPGVDVLPDAGDHLVGVAADDPARGDLLDRQGVGRLLDLDVDIGEGQIEPRRDPPPRLPDSRI